MGNWFQHLKLSPETIGALRSRHGTRWRCWDFVVGMFAFQISWLITPWSMVMPQPYYLIVVGALFGFTLATFSRICGVPNPEHRATHYELITLSLLAVLLSLLVFAVIIALVLVRTYGRYIFVITAGFSLAGMVVPRVMLMHVFRMQPINVIIYGLDMEGRTMFHRLKNDPHFRVLGFLDDDPESRGTDYWDTPVLGSVQDVGHDRLIDMKVHLVVICVHSKRLIDENARLLTNLPLEGIEVLYKGAFVEHYFKEMTVEHTCPVWVMSSPSLPGNPSIFASKRLIDVGFSVTGLLLTLPLWPFIALAVKLSGPGPVFFKQDRVGYKGRVFRIVKFRTMRQDAEKDGPQWATVGDPRTTPIGRFLRITRIDEIPQLLNILKGDMTLVGPRPERPEFVEDLTRDVPYYEQRHLVPPGLTGWAQVRYRYGASKEDAIRKLQFDLYYVRHMSLLFDIEIILRTVPLMAKGSR